MDSQDSHHHHHHHNHHNHHPPPPAPAAFLNPHTQHQPLANNSYQIPNNNSVNLTTSNANIMHHQNPRFQFNSMAAAAAAKPLEHNYSDGSPSGGGGGGFSIEPARKKRGRPRKYSPDNSIGLGLSPVPSASQNLSIVVHNDSIGGGTPSSDTPGKRHRGRPPGSVKKQLDALGLPGVGFTPHVLIINIGEDIASKIFAFSQEGPRSICILSANGAISSVTLRQPAMSGGAVTYEGRFEIISLSGSFQLSESNGNQSRTGCLGVSLAGSDGSVIGGGVAGILKAASTVQVIVGSFIPDGKKPKSSRQSSTPPPSNMLNFGAPVTGASPSPGDSSESGEENDGSPPLNRVNSGPYNNAGHPIQNMPMYSTMGWPNSIKMHPN